MSEFKFGTHVISRSIVFFQSRLSYAFVNRKPILPGHVLVSPKRVVKRFADMTSEEVKDLFIATHQIVPVMEQHYHGTATNIAIQDGKEAGQSIEHVHVHIIPRKQGDFERNDDIYVKLESHDKDDTNFRSLEEMAHEANTLAELFK